jgi:hypothetical protein
LASFIALYRGETISSARLVAATTDAEIVHDFADRMLSTSDVTEQDDVLREVELGRRRALHLVRGEASE